MYKQNKKLIDFMKKERILMKILMNLQEKERETNIYALKSEVLSKKMILNQLNKRWFLSF